MGAGGAGAHGIKPRWRSGLSKMGESSDPLLSYLQWYMVVFITFSMHTKKTNLLTSVFEPLMVTF